MSTFGTGSTTTAGASITLRNFTGTDGNQAGTDGLVPGPALAQEGYVLGAGGDWTLEIKAVADPNDATERIATTRFVANYVANAQLGGNALLSALGDVGIANIADDQFLQYNVGNARWENATLTIGAISDVNLAGLQAGNTIVWDAVNSEWIPGQGGGGGAATLDELGDVTIAGVANKHFLVHNGAGQFVNRLITTTDLDDGTNIALLDAANDFTNTLTVTNSDIILSTPGADKEIIISDGVQDLVAIGNDGPYIRLRTGDPQKAQYGDQAFTLDVWDFTNNLRMWDANGQVSFSFSRGTGDLSLSGDLTAVDASLAGIEATSLTSTANSFPITFADAQASALVLKDANANEYMVFDTDNDQIINKVEAEFGVAPAAVVRVGGGYVRFSGGGGEIAFPDLDPVALTLKDSANNNIITIDTAQNQVNHHVKSVFTNGAGNTLTVQHNALTFGGGDGEISASSKLNVVIKDNELVADGAAFSIADDGATEYLKIFTDNADQKIVLGADLHTTNLLANSLESSANSFLFKLTGGQATSLRFTDLAGNTDYLSIDTDNDLIENHVQAKFLASPIISNSSLLFRDGDSDLSATTHKLSITLKDNELVADGAAFTIKDGGATEYLTIFTDNGDQKVVANVDLYEGANRVLNVSNSIDALSDVDTTTNAPVPGQALVWDGANFVPGTGGKTQEEIEDIVGGMVAGNTETGIAVTYVDNGALAGKLDFVVDDGVVGFLAGAQNFGGDKTFSGALTATGDTDLTGANFVRVPAPVGATDATTKGYVDTAIAGRQPLEATLTGLATIAPVVNDIIIATGNDTFDVINTTAGMQTFLGTNLTIQAGAVGDVLRVTAVDGQNIPTAFENTKLASTDLSDTADLILRDGSVAFTGAVDLGAQNITNVADIALDTISADNNTITINLTDNQASALNITEAGNSYLNFVTTDAGEKVVFGKLFEAPTLSKIGDIEISNGQIQTTNVNNNLSFNDNNLLTTGTLGAGATTVTSLSVSEGNITNVSDIALDTISADGDTIVVSMTDNRVGAFEIKEGNTSYLNVITTNGGEKIEVGQANAGIALDLTNASVTATTQPNNLVEGNSTLVATTEFVRTVVQAVGNISDLDDLADVNLGVKNAGQQDEDGVALANAQILVYDDDAGVNDNSWKNVSLSGDIEITNAGVATIADNAITTVKINDGEVTNAKLENSYVAITDGANTDNLPLGQTLTFNAVANETTVVVSADQGAGADGVEITIGLPDDVTIAQDLTVTRNLIVNGTTTTIDTTNLDIEDAVIRLNRRADGNIDGANGHDIGIFMERGTNDHAIFYFDEGEDIFKLGTTTSAHTATDFDATTTFGTLKLATLTATSNSTIGGTLGITGDVSVNAGQATITAQTGNITTKGDFVVLNPANGNASITISADNDDVLITSFGGDIYFDNENLWTTGSLSAGSTSLTSLVVNDAGAAVDFRVEGDNQTHLLYTDGTRDRVGINTNAPDTQFHVVGATKLVGALTHTTGAVFFNSGQEDFDFRVDGDNQANLLFVDASADSIGIGKNNPSKTLDITGTVAISSTLDVSGKTTLAGSLDLTTGSATGITFRSEIGNNGADADQILLRVNQGGAGPVYKSIKWVAADDRFSIESSLKSEGNFTVGADQFTVDASNGNTSVVGTLGVGGATTINNAGGTADLLVQNNGADVLNVDVSAGTTTVTGQLKTDDLRAKTADGGGNDFKIRIEDNVANALEISDATNGLSFMVFDTRDNAELINFNQDIVVKGEVNIEQANANGIFFNSDLGANPSIDATLITIDGGNTKGDVVLGWDTSDNAINLNANAQVHLQGLAGSNALTIGGALVANATIVMTTAGAITLDGTLDSPTINTDKITDRTADGLVIELADALNGSALLVKDAGGANYLTINTDAQTLTFNEDVNFDASATFDTTVEVTGITTLNDSLKVNKAGSDTGIIFNADRGAGENINAQDFDALLLHVENGGSNATDAYIKWDDSESSFKIEGGKLFSATEISVGTEAANVLTKNLTIGTDGSVETSGEITTSSVVNFTTASQGAIVFNSDLGNVAPNVDDDFGLTVNRGNTTDAKLYWDEGDDAWKIETGNVQVQNTLVVDSDAANKVEIAAGSITTANDSGISFGADSLTTTGSITSATPALNTNSTIVATTAFVKGQKLGDFDQVNTAGFNANDQILVWDQDNSEFKAGASVYAKENAIDDVAEALINGSLIKDGDDGGNTGADTIQFTLDDQNDIINLALGISSGNLTDVSTDAPANLQVLRYTTEQGANQNKYVPTTLGTAADVDTGLDNGEIPTLTTHYLANQSETADLILTGRVIETIDYGSVTEAFDGATDYAFDMNGGVEDFSDTVIYGSEDYGMLVV